MRMGRTKRGTTAAWAGAALLLMAGAACAHLCNNIYRTPDRVIVKPEKPVATVVGTEDFRVFIQNNYPTYLDNLRLAAKLDSDDVTAEVTPAAIKRLKAGERTSFRVKLTSRPGAAAAKHALSFSISADNIDWRPVEKVSTDALRDVITRDENISATIQAGESLVARHDPLGTKYLVGVAGKRGSDRDYRARATRALGKGGDKANIAFLRTLLDEQDGFVKGNALLALGLLGDKASTFSHSYEDRDRFVRAAAMAGRVLAGGREKELLVQLKQDLKSSNAYVCIAAGWGLGVRRDRDAIAALDQAFATDDAMQRTCAGDALVDLANRR